MGQYSEALQASVRRQVASGKSVEDAYAFILDKLNSAMKAYEAGTNELLGIGHEGGTLALQQKSMFDKFEQVRQVTEDMIRELDLLRIDGWKP